MYHNEFQEVAKKPKLLASLIGFINSATIIPAIAIGAVIFAVKKSRKLQSKNEELLARKNSLAKRNQFLEDELEDYCDAEYEEIDDPTALPTGNVTLGENPTVEAQPFNGSNPQNTANFPTDEPTVATPFNPTVESGTINGTPAVENMTDEQLKKELLRQTMSELGKRSAAKRAREKMSK